MLPAWTWLTEDANDAPGCFACGGQPRFTACPQQRRVLRDPTVQAALRTAAAQIQRVTFAVPPSGEGQVVDSVASSPEPPPSLQDAATSSADAGDPVDPGPDF